MRRVFATPGPLRRRGVALIMALLIVALTGMIATNLAWDNALDVRRTSVLLNRDQAVQVALGAESWVALILKEDAQNSQTDHLGEVWASELPGLPIDGGEVFGTIEDLQGRFNVNNLVDQDGKIVPEAVEQFKRLLASLDLEPRFAGVAADWLDSDRNASFPDGGEDGIYSAIQPGYLPPNHAISSTHELLALDGMDKATFDRLEPNISALPRDPNGSSKINVNTATPAVLRSLDENIGEADVERLVSERQAAGFDNLDTVFDPLVQDPQVRDTLDESSHYFQLKVVVRIDTVRVTLYSTLFRPGGRGDVASIVRSFGTT